MLEYRNLNASMIHWCNISYIKLPEIISYSEHLSDTKKSHEIVQSRKVLYTNISKSIGASYLNWPCKGDIENPNDPRHLFRGYKIMHYQYLRWNYFFINRTNLKIVKNNVSTYQQNQPHACRIQ